MPRFGLVMRGSALAPPSPPGAFNNFGQYNTEGTGKIAVPSAPLTGNEAGHFQVSANLMTVSAAGQAAGLNLGPYVMTFSDGSTRQYDIVPDAYVVGDILDWNNGSGVGFGLLGADVLEGRSIRFRPGSYALGITGTSGAPLHRKRFGTVGKGWLGVKICADDPANPPIRTDSTIFVTFQYAIFEDFPRQDGLTGPAFTFLESSSWPVSDIIIRRCDSIGPVKSLTSDPGGLYASTGVNAYNPSLFLTTNGTSYYSNIQIEDCRVKYMRGLASLGVGPKVANAGNLVVDGFVVKGNAVEGAWAIILQASMGKSSQRFVAWLNDVSRIVSLPSDNGLPHEDGILVSMDDVATSDAHVSIVGNTVRDAAGRGPMPGIALRDATKTLVSGIAGTPSSNTNGVASITNANPGVVTISAAVSIPIATGQLIYISGSTSMTGLNDTSYSIVRLSDTTFTLKTYPGGVDVDTTSLGAFTANTGIKLTRYTPYGFVGEIIANVSNGRTGSEGLVCQNVGTTIPAGRGVPMTIMYNTVADPNYPSSDVGVITCGYNLPNGTAFGASLVAYNIAEAVSGVNVTLTENVAMGGSGTPYSYADVMDGPTWKPGTWEEVFQRFNPKAGGPAFTIPSGGKVAGAIGSGAVSWPTSSPGHDGTLNV